MRHNLVTMKITVLIVRDNVFVLSVLLTFKLNIVYISIPFCSVKNVPSELLDFFSQKL